MNYTYDVLLNFNQNLYEFYEWNLTDEIYHIRKIPLFRVTTNELYNLTNNDLKIEENFLKLIQNKTEVFDKKSIKNLKYAALFSDGDKVLAIKFNKNGLVSGRSSLLIDEEEEISDIVFDQKFLNFNYKILKENKLNQFKTRKEQEIDMFIQEKISKETDDNKLKYLYFDCFGKIENNKEKIIKQLKNYNNSEISLKIYNFFNLLNRN